MRNVHIFLGCSDTLLTYIWVICFVDALKILPESDWNSLLTFMCSLPWQLWSHIVFIETLKAQKFYVFTKPELYIF